MASGKFGEEDGEENDMTIHTKLFGQNQVYMTKKTRNSQDLGDRLSDSQSSRSSGRHYEYDYD